MLESERAESTYDDYSDGSSEQDAYVGEYSISVSPSDYNVMTLLMLVEKGRVRIPGFQRNFVWDINRASKLIESLILGLPIPQLFLFEQERNKNLLIDGQQRLMSIYYFVQQRFPRHDKRVDLRRIFDEHGKIPPNVLHSNDVFQDFYLRLPEKLPDNKNRLKGAKYETLNDNDRSQLDMRPIRCIFVRQNDPNDDSSMYEIFTRLNTGGITLRPQEIRTSMYHSEFYDMLVRINACRDWRNILGSPNPDLHMKDVEVLLRGFAMLIDGDSYAPSMVKFLNEFSRKSRDNNSEKNKYLEKLFLSFIDSVSKMSPTIFLNEVNNRFNIALYEAVFTAVCKNAYERDDVVECNLDESFVRKLKGDSKFIEASQQGTTQKANVQVRLGRACEILKV